MNLNSPSSSSPAASSTSSSSFALSQGNYKILVVEDEKDVQNLIHFNLFVEKYNVFLASDGESALEIAKRELPHLILLDIMLPKRDGLDVCQTLKSWPETKNIPIIMLTALGSEENIVKGLDCGADDYITKPFSPKILLARTKAILRRNTSVARPSDDHLWDEQGLMINVAKRRCTVHEQEIYLTHSEFQLLLCLMQTPGRVFTRGQIVEILRGENHAITDRSVDVQVVGLRKKLLDLGHLVETVRGVGYRYKEPELQ
jgi:two-component system alkaline phosphatase synthesis response regulator PhoP